MFGFCEVYETGKVGISGGMLMGMTAEEKKKILIVDDTPLNRAILRDILVKDYEVVEAYNGKEALEVLDSGEHRIAAIMLDIVMPVMNGYEFLEEFGIRDGSRNVPVIVLTGSEDRETERKALQLGAWDYVTKPFDGDIIKFRLKHVLERCHMSVYHQLKRDAEYDALTGIYNRIGFFAKLEQLLKEKPDAEFAFVRFDVNRFSAVNSYYGMPEGDMLLKSIAACLKQYAAQLPNFICGRLEADEFVFCTEYDNQEDVTRLVREMNTKAGHFDISFRIVLSFGIYLVKGAQASGTQMLECARIASKRIKGRVIRNYSFYTAEMGKELAYEQKIINEMNQALEESQFEIYLQPKYNLKTNKPEGAEALVRWNHPEEGMISPGLFIPIFERNGFIERLDYYVWEKVCVMLRDWLDDGIEPYPISVNLSRVNIYNPRLVELICGLTAKYGIPNHLLQLELTESAYTDNQIAIQETLDRLHDRGFTVLMDDFGSGYSSLNILKDLDVDILKIDMGFMTGGRRPGRGESIIASVVRMAKWLNIPVIAEGVEKEEQVNFLREIGCEYVQGFYFARPMPTKAYEVLAEKNEVFVPERNIGFNPDRLWETTPEMDQLFSSVLQAVGIYEIEDGQEEHIERMRVNNAFYELFGYEDMNNFSGNPLQSIKEEFRAPFVETVQTVIEATDVGELECVRTCANGKEMWIHVKMKYVHQVGNRHIVMCSFFDVTEQKEIDLELQKYRSLLSQGKQKTDRILVVDDVEFNRDLLSDIFSEDYEIITAQNGSEALDRLKEYENHVDLILLDMVMPVMNGNQFLEYRRKQPDIAGIPVIIITADDSPTQQINTLALGANDYITKPFVPEIVVRRVQNVMESQMRFKQILWQYNHVLQKSQLDSLTGLYNQESAEGIIDEILDTESERKHALMLLDVQRFRDINIQYGSGNADRVLQEIAMLIRKYFRANDIVARIEGDLFCIFMTAVPSKDMVVNKCKQLYDKMQELSVEGVTERPEVTIGVTVTQKGDRSFDKVYKNAKKALKKAKEQNDGNIAIYP